MNFAEIYKSTWEEFQMKTPVLKDMLIKDTMLASQCCNDFSINQQQCFIRHYFGFDISQKSISISLLAEDFKKPSNKKLLLLKEKV